MRDAQRPRRRDQPEDQLGLNGGGRQALVALDELGPCRRAGCRPEDAEPFAAEAAAGIEEVRAAGHPGHPDAVILAGDLAAPQVEPGRAADFVETDVTLLERARPRLGRTIHIAAAALVPCDRAGEAAGVLAEARDAGRGARGSGDAAAAEPAAGRPAPLSPAVATPPPTGAASGP